MNELIKKEIVEYVNGMKLEDKKEIWKEVRDLFNFKYGFDKSEEAYRHIYRENKELFNGKVEEVVVDNKPSKVTIELRDGMTISERMIYLSESDCKDAKMLLKAHGFNPNEFELVSARNNFWGDFEKPCYQSKVSVKLREDRSKVNLDDVKSFFDMIKENKFEHNFKLIELDNSSDRYCLEVDWADIHIGSLSDADEVGENNDYKIAFGNIKKVVAEIIDILNTRKVEKITHCFLGDFLHFDNVEGETVGRTRLDTDSRPLKMIKKAFEIAMYIIDNTGFVPMEVKSVLGNHSQMVEFSVFWALSIIYRDVRHIKFDVDERARKVFVYGDNLIGLAHGNNIGKNEQDLWLQDEFRHEWADCTYAEVHTGHLHQEILFSEKGGITKRTNPTLKVIDKYEYDHAWSSKKVVLAYLWHKEKNLREIFYLK